MKSPIWPIPLGVSATASGVLLVLILMETAPPLWVPLVCVAAVALVVAAAAGAWDWAERRRTRTSRRIIANLRAVGAEMEADGYFQTDQERRLLTDAYSTREGEA